MQEDAALNLGNLAAGAACQWLRRIMERPVGAGSPGKLFVTFCFEVPVVDAGLGVSDGVDRCPTVAVIRVLLGML